MKFYILKLFLNSGERLKIYFSSKKKKISIEIYLEKVSSLTEKVPKCKISFFISPEFERSCFGREFVKIVFFSSPKVCREKVFF